MPDSCSLQSIRIEQLAQSRIKFSIRFLPSSPGIFGPSPDALHSVDRFEWGRKYRQRVALFNTTVEQQAVEALLSICTGVPIRCIKG
jgi:hypothetical protein